MIRNREEKKLRVLGIVRRIQRVKKMGKKRGRGKLEKEESTGREEWTLVKPAHTSCDSGLIQRGTEIKERG